VRLYRGVGFAELWVLTGWSVALAVAGCGRSGPGLAGVTGVVTLNGKPLPGALVEFQPPGGSPSEGITNREGAYRLKFSHGKHGAMIGTHTVRINTDRGDEDESGEAIVEEVVPARYNRQSELTAEVKPGNNAIDFSLNSVGSRNRGAIR
jgi:hypothetical protein